MPSLPLLCFNDVYRVNQKYNPQPGAPEDKSGNEINVSQFAHLLLSERAKWKDRQDGSKEGLVLFAGDIFNPSVESSVTRGSHMTPISNGLKVDASCVGNHDWDFGYPHLTKLINASTFPWLMSNIVDKNTGQVPPPLKRYHVFERCGVRIGVIGLVEEDWIATIPSWPDNFVYRSMVDVGMELSKELRDPKGENVDLIIALTHCRVPNDIKTCNSLGAVNPSTRPGLENEHGVDLLIGGHDHVYFIGKGAASWDGYSGRHGVPDTMEDNGVHLIKSGTDFRDLSSADLELTPQPAGSVRKHLITRLTGKHHYILPSSPSDKSFTEMVQSLLSSVSEALSKPVCFTLSAFDARSEIVRTQEVGLGNWIADVLMHAYAENLLDGGPEKEKSGQGSAQSKARLAKGGADAVILCGGTLRGDSQYGPGKVTLGDILEILPFEDPVVCLEIDGEGIWDTLESALSKWPAQEGRFPIISGLVVQWDHTKPSGSRVLSIHELQPDERDDDEVEHPQDFIDFREHEDGTQVVVRQRKLAMGDPVQRDSSKTYRVITRDYMAQGYDGFEALKNRKFIVDDENGQIMSSILRSFLLGSSYIFRHKQLEAAANQHLSKRTDRVLSRARQQHQHSPSSSLSSSPQSVKGSFLSPGGQKGGYIPSPVSEKSNTLAWSLVRRHVVQHDWTSIRDAMHVAKHEHMSSVDEVAGEAMREHKDNMPGDWPQPGSRATKPDNGEAATPTLIIGKEEKHVQGLTDDLAIVCPLVDGRLRDVSADKQ
ncbi:hypothetical protein IAU60_006318 [Kwoniella sp. DSM 27419]